MCYHPTSSKKLRSQSCRAVVIGIKEDDNSAHILACANRLLHSALQLPLLDNFVSFDTERLGHRHNSQSSEQNRNRADFGVSFHNG